MSTSEETSLTFAVQLSANASMSDAVRRAAGRRSRRGDGPQEVADDALGREPAANPVAAYTRRAAVALLVLGTLHAAATPTSKEADRTPAAALPRRVALVVGNSAYRHASRLPNPRNDAVDMGAVLRRLGFELIEGFDLDKPSFDAKVGEFAHALKGAAVGLFFYAGHGLQVAGQNYLVPVDAKLTSLAALDAEMVRLDAVHQTMEQEAQARLLFFDACRDNPLIRNLARAMGLPSDEIGRGLAAVESAAGTLISFSTQPGNVALDGVGRNSPFSAALVRQLETSSDDLNAILIAVRNDVMRETDNRQVPWEHSALTRRFYFKPQVQSASAARLTAP